ncbi:MAG: ABC transporter ATP-binding protein, partial [Fervidicoccaceae archaeon]
MRLNDVYYKYDESGPWVLRGVTTEVRKGRTLVVGATGSGKSTLLRVASGLAPSVYGGTLRGRVEIMSRVVVVPQLFEVFILMRTPEEELRFVAENESLPWEEASEKIGEIAERLGIEKILRRNVSRLSMGEKQRVAIASALLTRAELLMLDEPLAYLDPRGCIELIELLSDLEVEGVVVADHRLHYFDGWYDRILVVIDGRVIEARDLLEVGEILGDTVYLPIHAKLGFRRLEDLASHLRARGC